MLYVFMDTCVLVFNHSVGASSADSRERVPRADETPEGRGARARVHQAAPDRCRQANASGS